MADHITTSHQSPQYIDACKSRRFILSSSVRKVVYGDGSDAVSATQASLFLNTSLTRLENQHIYAFNRVC